jgi:class 3 adenylate cyclase
MSEPTESHTSAQTLSSSEEQAARANPAREQARGRGAPAGAPFLLYRDESDCERMYVLDAERAATIGRSEDVDLSLMWDASVSTVHAEAVWLGTHWTIVDEGMSRNGTFVNNERVRARRRLRNGDLIRVGRTVLTFNEGSAAGRSPTTIIDGISPTGTMTLLFTDLVGSTMLLDQVGDDAGDRFLRDHFSILRNAINNHNGEEVKTLGDGLMVAFPSALSAVACAREMHQSCAAHVAGSSAHGRGLRIGLNAGEVTRAEDDYFGMPVVVAKRLCDRAAAGQAIVSDVVRVLVGSRGEHRFTALGALELKGLTDPVEAFELDWRTR